MVIPRPFPFRDSGFFRHSTFDVRHLPAPVPSIHQFTNPPIPFMIIGVPKEIKGQEYRVALLPSAAYQLIKRGHEVIVERSAGTGACYPDADYDQAGADTVSHPTAKLEQDVRVVHCHGQ